MAVTDFRRSKALRMGPAVSEFENTDQASTEAERDAYFALNPSNLAIYDGNSDLLIRLIYLVEDQLVTRYQSRIGGAWVDITPVVTGPSGEVASLAGVQIGEIPYKTVTGEFAGSNMRVLEDGTVLAPSGFTVESGSVSFGEVLTLSEVSGFLGITNHLNGNQYTVVDYATPRDAESAEPTVFHLIEPEFEFTAQGVDTTNLPDNPLIFDYTIVNTAKTNKLKFRTYAPMTNVRIKITQTSNGVVAKYIPNQQSWQEEFGGIDWVLGDNIYDFGDTSLIFNAGTELEIELRADNVALKGNVLGIPYFTATLQRGVFDDVITSRTYTAEDVKAKLESLSSPNKLAKTAIQDAVLTVNGDFGAVVVTPASIGAQPVDATLTALAGVSTGPNELIYSTGVDTFAVTPFTAYARTLVDDTTSAQARATLELGSIATQNFENVNITGGSIAGITDLAIADGGTGASTAAQARTNLGLATVAATSSYTDLINTPTLATGTYTPTLTNVNNVSASTSFKAQWMRVGNMVTVSGRVDIDPAGSGNPIHLGISLPVASNFTADSDCSGTGSATDVAGQCAGIHADTTNDRASLEFISQSTANQEMYYIYMYEVKV